MKRGVFLAKVEEFLQDLDKLIVKHNEITQLCCETNIDCIHCPLWKLRLEFDVINPDLCIIFDEYFEYPRKK